MWYWRVVSKTVSVYYYNQSYLNLKFIHAVTSGAYVFVVIFEALCESCASVICYARKLEASWYVGVRKVELALGAGHFYALVEGL
jgi:hypothetical protein